MNTNKFKGVGNLAIAVMGVLALAWSAQAASFDCTKASTKVEHIICDNPEISKLDDELAASYKDALQDQAQAVSIKQAQKAWLKERNGCTDSDCVKRAYDTRLSSLNVNASKVEGVAATQNANSTADQVSAGITTSSAKDEACLAPSPPIDWRNYEWTLIRGSGQPICEEMLTYLESRPQDIAPPTCPEERLPPNGNWTRPELRILSEAEKQVLLSDIPDKYRQKPRGPVSYEREIRDSKLLRVIRGDITGDGVPESFLAIGGYDGLKNCERSKRCAQPGEITNHWIELTSDAYTLLPMNDAGTQVNWSHRSIYANQLIRGELVFYKGLPYWMSIVSWNQYYQDHFSKKHPRPDDPLSSIFMLYRISSYSAIDSNNRTPSFKDVTAISIDWNPNSNHVCRFGYFRRENLDQYQNRGGK